LVFFLNADRSLRRCRVEVCEDFGKVLSGYNDLGSSRMRNALQSYEIKNLESLIDRRHAPTLKLQLKRKAMADGVLVLKLIFPHKKKLFVTTQQKVRDEGSLLTYQ
jgi:hypothetical protein